MRKLTQKKKRQRQFVLMLFVAFIVVAFLTGCSQVFGNILGFPQVIRHDPGIDITIDDSLEIPPDTLNTSVNTTVSESMLFVQKVTYIEGPSNLECYVVTPEGNKGCEGFYIWN